MKKLMLASLVFALGTLALAASPVLAAVEKTDGFVCPVIVNGKPQSPNAVQLPSGEYTIIGPDVSVPIHATNANGAGSPGGDHSAPNDTDYTAIWSR